MARGLQLPCRDHDQRLHLAVLTLDRADPDCHRVSSTAAACECPFASPLSLHLLLGRLPISDVLAAQAELELDTILRAPRLVYTVFDTHPRIEIVSPHELHDSTKSHDITNDALAAPHTPHSHITTSSPDPGNGHSPPPCSRVSFLTSSIGSWACMSRTSIPSSSTLASGLVTSS